MTKMRIGKLALNGTKGSAFSDVNIYGASTLKNRWWGEKDTLNSMTVIGLAHFRHCSLKKHTFFTNPYLIILYVHDIFIKYWQEFDIFANYE